MKKRFAIVLSILLCLPVLGFAGDAPQFLTAQELLARDEVRPSVEFNGDEVPTIYRAVGRR